MMKKCYFAVLVLWAITGLPIIVLAIRIAGDSLLSLDGLLTVLSPPLESAEALLTWLMAWVIILYPLILLPFALRRRGD